MWEMKFGLIIKEYQKTIDFKVIKINAKNIKVTKIVPDELVGAIMTVSPGLLVKVG